jgi:integrase
MTDKPTGDRHRISALEVWGEARKQALTPVQYRSPLGRRPYDLRHAAVSLWLNSGVPATGSAVRLKGSRTGDPETWQPVDGELAPGPDLDAGRLVR